MRELAPVASDRKIQVNMDLSHLSTLCSYQICCLALSFARISQNEVFAVAHTRQVHMEMVVEALLIVFLPKKRAHLEARKHGRQIVLPILCLQLVLSS